MDRRSFLGFLGAAFAWAIPASRGSALPALAPEGPGLEPAVSAPEVPVHLRVDELGLPTHWKSSRGWLSIRHEMDDEHIMNALRYIERQRAQIMLDRQNQWPSSEWSQAFVEKSRPYWPALFNEAKRRGLDCFGLGACEVMAVLIDQRFEGDLYREVAANLLGCAPEAVSAERRHEIKLRVWGGTY